jgi:predicted nucleic acid-binding protein
VSVVVSDVAILIDDRKGRAAAMRVGLRVTGTIGLLEVGAARGLTDLAAAVEVLRQTNARLDEDLLAAALARARSRDSGRP